MYAVTRVSEEYMSYYMQYEESNLLFYTYIYVRAPIQQEIRKRVIICEGTIVWSSSDSD